MGTRLERAVLSQAWLLEADLSGASLKDAILLGAQLQRAKLDGADLSGARVAADFSGASLVGASIANGKLGVDSKNQSMGLMRSVLRSANLKGVNARGADLSRADLEFASLVEADLTGASLMGALLGGADLTGAIVTGTDFDDADLVSTRLIRTVGLDAARNLDKAKNWSGRSATSERIVAFTIRARDIVGANVGRNVCDGGRNQAMFGAGERPDRRKHQRRSISHAVLQPPFISCASAAMSAAPALAQPSPRQKSTPRPDGVDVIIVGAGAAGIAAARRLIAAGRRVAIVEAASEWAGAA